MPVTVKVWKYMRAAIVPPPPPQYLHWRQGLMTQQQLLGWRQSGHTAPCGSNTPASHQQQVGKHKAALQRKRSFLARPQERLAKEHMHATQVAAQCLR